ncbi:hypothetical protein TrLO_g428 [Triparma laevis f. longispina]|uniref:Uncharacterized protein n=1 Tax=Triparma laevis f. longispina TaxID=1714387 RepID=A0A9W7A4B5_9STRA|nr:hypothetical protein TrLO_g428 [Triparma laevis f. longispina]
MPALPNWRPPLPLHRLEALGSDKHDNEAYGQRQWLYAYYDPKPQGEPTSTWLPLYLEASGLRNMAIYEIVGFGYNVVKTYGLEVEGDEPGWEPFNELYAMMRLAKGSSAIQPTVQTIGR